MSYTKQIIFITCLFILSSCSFYQSKPQRNYELLSGTIEAKNLSKKEIEKNLQIHRSLALNTFQVKVMPLIQIYIERFKGIDKILQNIPNTTDKTCFITEINSDSSHPLAADFNTWKAEILDAEDDYIHMEWTKDSLALRPSFSTIPSYHGPKKRYHNRGILCAVDKIVTSRYFQLKLSPKHVQWPLKDDMLFDWRVPYKVIENGLEITKRKKKENSTL